MISLICRIKKHLPNQQPNKKPDCWVPELGGGAGGIGKMGEGGQKYKHPVISHADVMCSVVTIVDNTALHI